MLSLGFEPAFDSGAPDVEQGVLVQLPQSLPIGAAPEESVAASPLRSKPNSLSGPAE